MTPVVPWSCLAWPVVRQLEEAEQQLARLTDARNAALDDARLTEAAAQQALESTQESFRVLQKVGAFGPLGFHLRTYNAALMGLSFC